MELRILGPLEVLDDDGRPVDVGGARPRTLLVDLALAHGHAVPADQLLEDVWSGEAIPARNNLQVHVSRLRRALGEDRIATRGGGYALDLPDDALDATRFDRLASAGRTALHAGDAMAAADALRRALALWRGGALVDFVDAEFARPVITRLEEARFAAIEDRIDAELELGRHGELVGELEGLVQEHPLRERLWAQLMIALYRCGRQADAFRAYQRARTELAEQLGIDPGPELKRLEDAVLAQDASLAAPRPTVPTSDSPGAGAPPGNLPRATAHLVGRQKEMDATVALVRQHRVTTVVGPGGVGKSRLAIEVARALADEPRDGVWLADLSPVASASAVPVAIATALGVETEHGTGASVDLRERLTGFLRDREILLVLDNCEPVVAAAAEIVEHLVGRCPTLRVLATSREPLMIAGEVLWPLTPLALDDAATLFLEHARAVDPGFDDSRETTAIVRSICDHLDCLPLAIELAAARMRAFMPLDLLSRLGDRFRLLTTGTRTAFPRQQTLRAVIDWSYDLLFDEERRVFERISLFAGSFTLEAAEEVCRGGPIHHDDVAELLARLVDKSLVTASPTEHGAGFRVLKTLAQYGRERLAESGDADATRTRHARQVASVVEVPDAEHGPARNSWFERFGATVDDFRSAMDWAIAAGDCDLACALAGALGWYWNMGGRIEETWAWMKATLALAEPEAAHPRFGARRIRVLAWAGALGVVHDSEQALEFGAEAVARARELGDDQALGLATMLHGSTLSDFFHLREPSTSLFQESRDAFTAIGDGWSLAMAALMRGAISLVCGDFDGALPELRESADRFGDLDNAWGRGAALRHLADVATIRGRYDEATRALHEAIAGLHAVGALGNASSLTARLANIDALEGRYDEAERRFEAALVAARRQAYVPTLALTYNLRGIALRRRGLLDTAEYCHQAPRSLYSERGAPAGLGLTLAGLGYIAKLRGDAPAAAEHHRASLLRSCEAGDFRGQALALEGLAGAESLLGHAEAVGRLLGAAARLRDLTGGPLFGPERIDVDRATDRVRAHAATDATFTDGHSDPERVVRDALGALGTPPD